MMQHDLAVIAKYRTLRPSGGGRYVCHMCERTMAGARQDVLFANGALSFCLDCWPKALDILEAETLKLRGKP